MWVDLKSGQKPPKKAFLRLLSAQKIENCQNRKKCENLASGQPTSMRLSEATKTRMNNWNTALERSWLEFSKFRCRQHHRNFYGRNLCGCCFVAKRNVAFWKPQKFLRQKFLRCCRIEKIFMPSDAKYVFDWFKFLNDSDTTQIRWSHAQFQKFLILSGMII